MSDFWRTLCLLPYFMCTKWRLWRDCVDAVRLYDKYHNLMSWLIITRSRSRWNDKEQIQVNCTHWPRYLARDTLTETSCPIHADRDILLERSWPRHPDRYILRETPNRAWRQSPRTASNEPRHDKTNKVTVRPAKTQISLGIHPVWSESSLFGCPGWSESSLSTWRKLWSLTTHWAHSEDSDQTGR